MSYLPRGGRSDFYILRLRRRRDFLIFFRNSHLPPAQPNSCIREVHAPAHERLQRSLPRRLRLKQEPPLAAAILGCCELGRLVALMQYFYAVRKILREDALAAAGGEAKFFMRWGDF